jgi:hypothetical protein
MTDSFDPKSLPDRRADRVKLYLSALGRIEKPEQDERVDVERGKLTYIKSLMLSPENLMYLFADILLKAGMPTYTVLNVYDFVRIHWDEHPDFSSYHHIKTDYVFVWGGYSEMVNKSLEIMTEEFLVRRKVAGLTTVVALKQNVYRDLDFYLMGAADNVITYGVQTSKTSSRKNTR